MLQVELNHILSEADALARVQEILADVETNGETYVVMKDGRPAVAIIDISRLEQYMGQGQSAAQTPQETQPTTVAPEPAYPQQNAAPYAEASAQLPPISAPVLTPSVPQSQAQPESAPVYEQPAAPTPLEAPQETVATDSQPIQQEQQVAAYAQPAPTLPDMPDEDLDNDSPLA